MFRIKICGITSPTAAKAVASAGADAIGLNFYARSPRCVEPRQAKEIADLLPAGFCKVGLFVNDSAARIREIQGLVGLDWIQLHGDESPAFVGELAGLPVLKAFRASSDVRSQILEFVQQCRQSNTPLAGVLLDAYQPGSYGGTGQTADWTMAGQLRSDLGELPLILAGGLTPGNVAEAISTVAPWGVDTASGVESAPGVKDPELVQQFVSAAQVALQGTPK